MAGDSVAAPLALQASRKSQLSEHPALALSLKARARTPIALLSGRFLARETMVSFAWNIRDLHCYSVCVAASQSSHLVRNLVRVVFALRAPQKANAAKSQRMKLLRLAGLELATSGAIGRRAD